jgi:hypothetical protein
MTVNHYITEIKKNNKNCFVRIRMNTEYIKYILS